MVCSQQWTLPGDMLSVFLVHIHCPYSRPSPVLLAIGVPPHIALNALRVSVGRETSIEDINTFIKDLTNAVKKLDALVESGPFDQGH